jgi:diguanylate cyclase (GGDEF)-like protein
MKSNETGLEKSISAESSQTQLDLISDALDASEDGFAIWKSVRAEDGSISDFVLLLMNNSGLAGLAGLDHKIAEPIGKTLEEVTGAESSKELHDLFVLALIEGHGVKGVVPGITSDGSKGTFENTVVPFGRDLVFATYRDVSADEREHKRLVWLTEHDFLTGMPNRAKLQEHLAESFAIAQENRALMAFIFIDIDYFKHVNDTYGHDVGDALLVNFVKRIRHSLPARALVARISGDEFGVCIQDVKGMEHLKELMENVFAAMERPFTLGKIETKIACSAGCVVTDGSDRPEEIMRIADKMMYQAKHEGRGRFIIHPQITLT